MVKKQSDVLAFEQYERLNKLKSALSFEEHSADWCI